MSQLRRRVAMWLAGMSLLAGAGGSMTAVAATASAGSGTERAAELIPQLGAAEYARRERAQEELRRMGLSAFEALHAAQAHPDVEVRKRAEYLLHGIQIEWVQEDDPEDVKQLQRYYQQDEPVDRLTRLEQLGHLDHPAAFRLLARLARFETSETLSRRAALSCMRRRQPPHDVSDPLLAETLLAVVDESQRTAAAWLRLYAQTLQDAGSFPHDDAAFATNHAAWQQLIAAELDGLKKRPDKERIAVAREFLLCRIEMLQGQQRPDAQREVFAQLLPLQGMSVEDLRVLSDWLLDRQIWNLLEQLTATFSARFADDPYLGYRHAALLEHQGRADEAESRVQALLALTDLEEGELHLSLAADLQAHGRFAWAEREYRQVIANVEAGSFAAIEASYRLGYMFHDLSRHQDAYEALKVIVDLVQQDAEMMRRMQQLNHTRNRVFSQMHFSRALMLAEQKKTAEQQAALQEALKYDRENADILIAMYRVEQADDGWRKQTQEQIDRLREVYEQRVVSAEREIETLPGELTRLNLAQQLNQLAWLVANTYGDQHAAVRHSRRSLELAPEQAGYLDTLGRCYFAVKDYPNAVRYQRRAVELEPHSGQIRKQLELFEKSLAAAG